MASSDDRPDLSGFTPTVPPGSNMTSVRTPEATDNGDEMDRTPDFGDETDNGDETDPEAIVGMR